MYTNQESPPRFFRDMPGLLGSSATPFSLAEGVGSQSGYPVTPLHSGCLFTGYQQSKGNKYHVEVEFKVCKVMTS